MKALTEAFKASLRRRWRSDALGGPPDEGIVQEVAAAEARSVHGLFCQWHGPQPHLDRLDAALAETDLADEWPVRVLFDTPGGAISGADAFGGDPGEDPWSAMMRAWYRHGARLVEACNPARNAWEGLIGAMGTDNAPVTATAYRAALEALKHLGAPHDATAADALARAIQEATPGLLAALVWDADNPPAAADDAAERDGMLAVDARFADWLREHGAAGRKLAAEARDGARRELAIWHEAGGTLAATAALWKPWHRQHDPEELATAAARRHTVHEFEHAGERYEWAPDPATKRVTLSHLDSGDKARMAPEDWFRLLVAADAPAAPVPRLPALVVVGMALWPAHSRISELRVFGVEAAAGAHVKIPSAIAPAAWAIHGAPYEIGDLYGEAPILSRAVVLARKDGRPEPAQLPLRLEEPPRHLVEAIAKHTGSGLLSVTAGKLALLLCSTWPTQGGVVSVHCTLRELARWLFPGTRPHPRNYQQVAAGAWMLRGLSLVDGRQDIQLFDVTRLVDPREACGDDTFTGSLTTTVRLLAEKKGSGGPLANWFLLNLGGALGVDGRKPQLLRAYVWAAALWNDADKRGTHRQQGTCPEHLRRGFTREELAAHVAMQAPTPRKKDGTEAKAAIEELAALEHPLVRIETVGQTWPRRWRVLWPEAYAEAYAQIRTRGTRTVAPPKRSK